MRARIALGTTLAALALPVAAHAATAPDIGRVQAHTVQGRMTLQIPVTHHADAAVGTLGHLDVHVVVRRGGARIVADHEAPVLGEPEGDDHATHAVRIRLTRAQTTRLLATAKKGAAKAAATPALTVATTATATFDAVSPPATATQTVRPTATPKGNWPFIASEYTDGTNVLLVDVDAQNRDFVTRIITPVAGTSVYWDHYNGQVGTEATITYDPNVTTDGFFFAGAGQWSNIEGTVGAFPPNGTISGIFALSGGSVHVQWPAVTGESQIPVPSGSYTLSAVR